MSLDQVLGVIHMNGFEIGGKFLTREFAYSMIDGKYQNGSANFKIPNIYYYKFATEKDRRNIRYATRHVHGLEFFPEESEYVWPLWQFEGIFSECYHCSRSRNGSKFLVAYYDDGNYRRCPMKVFLDAMYLPSINLKNFGCPDYQTLDYPQTDCERHKHKMNKDEKEIYCSSSKVSACKQWLLSQINV